MDEAASHFFVPTHAFGGFVKVFHTYMLQAHRHVSTTLFNVKSEKAQGIIFGTGVCASFIIINCETFVPLSAASALQAVGSLRD